ncbi:MAG: NAD-dependent succinate-semialdehyde dehydrogenase [Myxococcota bacterium]
MAFVVVNPATGETLKTYEHHSPEAVAQTLEAASAAQRAWRRTTFEERAKHMRAAAAILRERVEPYAKLMTMEMGKPIREARGEVQKCALVCDFYADQAESMLARRVIETDARESYIAHRPLGVVLAIMPWNYPLWQVFRFLAPALMAGNGGILKHASNVPGCAEAVEAVVRDAGFPNDLFVSLRVDTAAVASIIEHPAIAAVTLTGSTPAGRAVAAKAGSMLKKVVLELGGSDPYVVLEDADIALAAKVCATSRLLNSGQSCIAAKRYVVVDAVHDTFVEAVQAEFEARVMGDPLDEATDIGPQARFDLRDALHNQVERSIAAGARLLVGGTLPDSPGAFYPATLLAHVGPGIPAYEEELFGPVGSIIRAKDEADAIRIANDTPFGLGACVMTADLERGRRIAEEELEAGCCFVNAFVRSDPRLPFGGIRDSGYGRELSDLGILEFVNQKTVYIA